MVPVKIHLITHQTKSQYECPFQCLRALPCTSNNDDMVLGCLRVGTDPGTDCTLLPRINTRNQWQMLLLLFRKQQLWWIKMPSFITLLILELPEYKYRQQTATVVPVIMRHTEYNTESEVKHRPHLDLAKDVSYLTHQTKVWSVYCVYFGELFYDCVIMAPHCIPCKLGQYHVFGWPGPRFNIKMPSYQYRKSHCGDKTVVRSSYLHKDGIFILIQPPGFFCQQVIDRHYTVKCRYNAV